MNVSYQKLLDRIPHLAWLMTDGGEIVAVNHQWHQYFGQRSGEEERPWLFAEILNEQGRAAWESSWPEAISLRTILTLKTELPDQDNWEWFQIELAPDLDEWGQPIWIGTAIDLGGEAAIPGQRQSTQFLEALLTNASDGIVACDADGHLVLFNLAAQAFHGMPPEPIEPANWAKFYDLYDRDGIRNLIKSEVPLFRAFQGEAVVNQEMMIKSHRGGNRSILASGTAFYSPTGQKIGAVIVMKDITAYKRAEIERLRVQLYNERLSIAMRVGRAGAWTWDLHTKQTFWTPEFEVLFDYEPGSTAQVYNEWLDRVHPDDLDRVETTLQQAIDGILPEYRCEYRIVLRNGEIRWIDVIGELTPDQAGNPSSMSGLVYDVTDRKQGELLIQTQTDDLQRLNNSLMLAQQKLQERNIELDRFVSIVAHDLKAPLRAIANLSEWIEEDLQEQIPGENAQLQLLRQRVKRMDALIDGLLRYSRAGQTELVTETVNVAEILVETIDSLSPPAQFEIKVISSMPILNTKRLLLTQVFANLISNAIKHHHPLGETPSESTDGQIEITATDLGDRHQFSIADNGPGIPEGESQSRVFEIFQTLNTATDSTENTGIGLALVKKIVEGEGGKIWLDHQYKLGCRFCFTWLKTTMPSQHRY